MKTQFQVRMTREYTICRSDELRALCIEKNWFTEGSIRQYEKMFEANSKVMPTSTIATIIWTCSDASYEEIIEALSVKRDEYLNRLYEAEGCM